MEVVGQQQWVDHVVQAVSILVLPVVGGALSRDDGAGAEEVGAERREPADGAAVGEHAGGGLGSKVDNT